MDQDEISERSKSRLVALIRTQIDNRKKKAQMLDISLSVPHNANFLIGGIRNGRRRVDEYFLYCLIVNRSAK